MAAFTALTADSSGELISLENKTLEYRRDLSNLQKTAENHHYFLKLCGWVSSSSG